MDVSPGSSKCQCLARPIADGRLRHASGRVAPRIRSPAEGYEP